MLGGRDVEADIDALCKSDGLDGFGDDDGGMGGMMDGMALSDDMGTFNDGLGGIDDIVMD
jgi:hypothetical protein